MNIVLDTNVIVSGFLTPRGVPGQILYRVTEGNIGLLVDARILQEYRMVLFRSKFDLLPAEVERFLKFAEDQGIWLVGTPLNKPLPDPDDAPFLEVALTAGAPLITGNLRDYPFTHRQGATVISPADFMEKLREK